jgi:hypothetical protein
MFNNNLNNKRMKYCKTSKSKTNARKLHVCYLSNHLKQKTTGTPITSRKDKATNARRVKLKIRVIMKDNK